MRGMDAETRLKWLRIAMVVTGLSTAALIPFAFDLWPAGFRWSHPAPHPAYERMIVAIYVSLGICLARGARNPIKNVIILDFTILSSVLHGAVMTYDSFAQEHEMMHLLGDVPLLFGVAALFIWLYPRNAFRSAA